MNALTIEQCADLFQVRPNEVKRWIAGGLLRARQDNSISSRALDVFVQRQVPDHAALLRSAERWHEGETGVNHRKPINWVVGRVEQLWSCALQSFRATLVKV